MNTVDQHLSRCVELAEEALNAGDAPFGSVLVDAMGTVLREDRNRVNTVAKTYHPEIELARWAAENLSLEQRKKTVMYTSGEHCPMCSAAHGWAELGKVVYIHSTQHLTAWHQEFGLSGSRVKQLPISDVVPELEVEGPIDDLLPQMYQLHKRYISSKTG
ncbi:nucleoside deaminase [Idiomarina seosinensis]|uniref:tRNA-specific adenosine deaminase n=1 Tax=Idiomarina seosinensis TaxID=281739 RepID=A0A432Z6P9_9GAMM|nr:nucleoside deaminase [Idiomarina seosinensis]RUO73582.1 tRNA-specific adenosine deaminase [Idiomarina seosinensis]